MAKGDVQTPVFHVTQRCNFVTVHFMWIWIFHAIWDVLNTTISGTITHGDQQDCCKQTLTMKKHLQIKSTTLINWGRVTQMRVSGSDNGPAVI